MGQKNVDYSVSLLTDYDVLLFKQGNHFRAYEKLGAHLLEKGGKEGTYFAVWAPNAKSVSVIGDFNNWDPKASYLGSRPEGSGIWEGFIPGVGKGSRYKFHITSNYNNFEVDKTDPYAFYCEQSPRTASVVWGLDHDWGDKAWMKSRKDKTSPGAPISIYEVHLGSWRRNVGQGNCFLNYRDIAPLLIEHVKNTGFTHVEFLPVMEHPFYGSWGYEPTGFYAATSRYGEPQDLMYLIDQLHQNNIGVILDWVPCHFPLDEHSLVYFDGTHLYEHSDPRKSLQPDWGCNIFNYGRVEVRNFLISSALFWLDKYHADGLRIDGVASMLYLDYSRKEGEWIPNEYGGRENLEAIDFLRRLNEAVYKFYPDTQTIAEESTAWPLVSRPAYVGGLGFGMKWNMGWMHDVLSYFSKDPIYRKYQHNDLTFSMLYAFTENFVLPLSHDELVYGKCSLLNKMPGDEWQKFANLRLLLGYFFTHPGKKLLFMGSEFGQWKEWDHESSLDWHLLGYPAHQGIQRFTRDMNLLYRDEPALHELDFEEEGFKWIDCWDWMSSILSFTRTAKSGGARLVVACNFTPVPRHGYRIGAPESGFWKEVLNSDAAEYGGSGLGNLGGVQSENVPAHGMPGSLSLTLPPLGIVVLKK